MAPPAFRQTLHLLIALLAAVFEVGGDALIRAGLRGKGWLLVALGFAVLGSYGLILNQVPLDFSRLLGVYVGLFALVSVLFGKLVFGEPIPNATWLGLAIVLVGSAVIQWA